MIQGRLVLKMPHASLLQVSGYIDYAQRLKADPNIAAYFDRTKRLMPRHSDLSYYNWETHSAQQPYSKLPGAIAPQQSVPQCQQG